MTAESGGQGGRRFQLFGMGGRRKLLYCAGGRLLDALTLEPVREFACEPGSERFVPAEYAVTLRTRADGAVRLREDEEGVWLERERAGGAECLTRGVPVRLPRFGEGQTAALLRALHAQLLVCLMPWGPVPNLWTYPRPWYRDAAMMLLCLGRTGNLALTEAWVAGLREVYDRNNRGIAEADNPGQVLLMLGLYGWREHPLVAKTLAELPSLRRGRHLCGLTDYAEHPVYQTKWLKYGLRMLGLADDFTIPDLPDRYSSLFWMAFRDQHQGTQRVHGPALADYPYLTWAEANFYDDPAPAAMRAEDFPLTWERRASDAQAWRMRALADAGAYPESLAREEASVPHTWHAAEVFLYYYDRLARD